MAFPGTSLGQVRVGTTPLNPPMITLLCSHQTDMYGVAPNANSGNAHELHLLCEREREREREITVSAPSGLVSSESSEQVLVV